MQTHKFILLFGFILGWFSLVTQFILLLQNSNVDILNSIVRFFSFFTILSNFLVSICFTTLFFKFSTLFKSYKTQTAIAVYISIVAIVYNIVLRFIWEPTGLQKIVDELLHVVNPILFVAFWFISKNKISLEKGIDVDTLLKKVARKYKSQPFSTVDGLKIMFNKNWVHLRKSNTEPIIRIYSEAKTEIEANKIANQIMEDIASFL